MSLAIVGDLAFATGEETTVPSGVPTEAPGEPVKLTVPEGKLTLTGCASPNAFISVFEDNSPVGSVVASSFGRFTKIIGNQGYGAHTIQAFQEDKLNNISTTATFNTTLAPHTNNFLDIFLPPTVYHDKDPAIIGEYLTFRGFTCPNANVNLNINKNLTLVAKANDFGNWWVVADTSLYALGTHPYTVISELNGELSAKSEQYIFRVARRYRANQGNLFPSELTVPQITSPKDGFRSGSKQVVVSGIGPANTQIELFAEGVLIGSTFSNPYGEWSITVNLTDFQSSFTARACVDGTCTEMSKPTSIIYGGDTDGCLPMLTLDPVRFWGLRRNDGVNLKMDILSGQPQYEMTLDWGDATVEHITLYRASDTSYHHVYKDIGQFNGSLTLKDSRGCQEVHFFSSGVTKDFLNIPWVQVLVVSLLISSLVALIHYIHAQHEERDFLAATIGRIRARGARDSDDTDSD